MEPAAQVCEFMLVPQQRSSKFLEEDCGSLPSALRPCCLRLADNPRAELHIPGPFSLSVDGVLTDVLYFVCQGVSLFILLSLLHSGYASRLNTITTGGAGKPTEQDGVLDEDVRAEKDLAKRFAERGAAAELEGEGYTLVVCDLHKSFGEVKAVRGISLVLRRAECFGLLGVNGAGKSTTFQMLTGLLEPSAGNAFMPDVNLEASPRKVRVLVLQ
ncbi:hypothetical protein V5799_011539 [Amblyomma americanum]|uniref:ABC transporter domain-containing protein n=1 Tax=Amblyomma americanum TaxID=6943 RepID=A0AAQ4EGZ6_AMBAM